jgi:hypothetical protein
MLSVIMPSDIMLSVFMLSVIMPSVIMPSVIMPSAIMPSVVMLNVVAPKLYSAGPGFPSIAQGRTMWIAPLGRMTWVLGRGDGLPRPGT